MKNNVKEKMAHGRNGKATALGKKANIPLGDGTKCMR